MNLLRPRAADGITRRAEVSPDGRYRYSLTRTWDPALPPLLWVMLNPSTADDLVDDPTIRRVMRFTRDAGYGEAIVCNLFAFRATRPEKLLDVDDPVGPENVRHLLDAFASVDRAVLAWGSGVEKIVGTERSHGSRWRSRLNVEQIAGVAGVDLYHLGRTKGGHPRHPLYVPAATRLGKVVDGC